MMTMSETQIMGYLLYSGALALIVIGLFVIVTRHHLIRILLGLGLLEAGVNLVLLAAGFRADAQAPIVTELNKVGTSMVDPVPQALILTAIVIGVGVLALALAICLEIHRKYKTLDLRVLGMIISGHVEDEPSTYVIRADQVSANKAIVPGTAERNV
jgi:multisubunit Na+/H+ antiporter MnhC subunit